MTQTLAYKYMYPPALWDQALRFMAGAKRPIVRIRLDIQCTRVSCSFHHAITQKDPNRVQGYRLPAACAHLGGINWARRAAISQITATSEVTVAGLRRDSLPTTSGLMHRAD